MKFFTSIKRILISLTLLITPLAYSQTSIFEDNFDTYTAGQKLVCQNSSDWTTWTLNPCNATEDPFISDDHSLSGANSFVIVENNDLVKTYGNLTSGICDISFQIYISTGKAGYFNTLAGFTPNTLNWAMQCWFDIDGNARLDANGASSATFPYNHDTWQLVRMVVDLEIDSAKLWFNNSLIKTWQWTKGWNGNGGSSPLRLDATDFFGATANDEMYIDDFIVKYYSKITSTTDGGDWNLSTTWVGGNVPTSGNPVEITGTATVNLENNVLRNANTLLKGELNCGSYIISGTGNFNVSSGATLGIGAAEGIYLTAPAGNIQVTGIRTYSSTADYVYNGSSVQSTGDGLSTFTNFIINNAAGIMLTENKTINGILTLTNGNVNTSSSNLLTIGAAGSINGGSLASFINGPLARVKNTSATQSLLFPIGKEDIYRPVEIRVRHNNTNSTTYTAEIFNTVPPNKNLPSSLDKISSVRYCNISKTGTANIISANITLNYGIDDGILDPGSLRIAKENGDNWVDLGGTVNEPSIVSTNQFTTLGNFVLANAAGGNNPLPVELSLFKAVYKGNKVVLNWITQTEVNNYGFEIERVPGEKLESTGWQKIGFIQGYGNSNSIIEYSFVDDKITSGKYFYRLKQIDNDGSYNYSGEVGVTAEIPTGFILEQNYPNPFNPLTKIKFSLPEKSSVKIKIFDALGNFVSTIKDEELEEGFHELNFDGSNLSSGIYYYLLETGGFTAAKKMILLK